MFYLKNRCPVCQTGVLGIRRCADGKNLVVICDECDSVWASPEFISTSNALFAEPPNFEIPELGIALVVGPGGWASSEEIASKGWKGYIAGEQPTG